MRTSDGVRTKTDEDVQLGGGVAGANQERRNLFLLISLNLQGHRVTHRPFVHHVPHVSFLLLMSGIRANGAVSQVSHFRRKVLSCVTTLFKLPVKRQRVTSESICVVFLDLKKRFFV